MSNKKEKVALKDFLYLDFDRVESFVAQMGDGVPETRTDSHSDGGNSGFKMPVVSANLATQSQTTETKSLRLSLFNRFETEARQFGAISSSIDQPLSLLRCNLRVYDYRDIADKIKSVSEIVTKLSALSEVSTKTKSEVNRIKKDIGKARSNDFRAVASIIKTVYGDSMRAIGCIESGQTIGMTLDRKYVQYEGSGFADDINDFVSGEWIVLCINLNSRKSGMHVESGGAVSTAVEDTVRLMLTITAQLTPSVDYNVVPVAIYREIAGE